MCERCGTTAAHTPHFARRSIFKFAAGAIAGVATAGLAAAPRAFAAPPEKAKKAPPKPENVVSPDAALRRLMEGNARYVKGETRRHDFGHERQALSTGQNPFAAILSCADSRIAPEFCFDSARGDLFVCRIAGNFASDEMIASLEYAVQVLNTPLIMVLGHEACGAVDATIKSAQDGSTLPGRLPSLVAAIRPAVEAAQGQPGDLLANAIRQNVKLNVGKLNAATPILKSFADDNKIKVIGGVYALRTGRVEFLS